MSLQTIDSGNIFRNVYEPSLEALNVNLVGSGTPTLPNVVEISNGTDFLTSTTVGSKIGLDVAIINMPEMVIDHTNDSIAIGTTTDLFTASIVGPKTGLDVNVINSTSTTVSGTVNADINGLNTFQTSQQTIGTSAVQLTPTPLTGRSSMSVKASTTSGNMVYIGPTSGVTTSNGYALFNGDSIQLDLTGLHQIWAISGAVAQTVFVLEIG